MSTNTDLVYPISIIWEFKDNLFNEFSGGERIKTRYFKLPGFPVTYYLTLEYHQVDDRTPGVTFVFNCFCDYDDVELVADFSFQLNTDNTPDHDLIQINCIFDDDNNEIQCYHDREWANYDSENIFVAVHGTFTIKEIHSIPLSIKVPKINQQIFADNNGRDFTIVAEGQDIKVHKAILQQVSPVFSAMFESKWKESVEGKIEMPFLAFKLAKLSIDLFYGKKYWRFLEKIEYIQLYQFADQYDITPLKNAVKNSIILTPLNIVEYANLVTENKCEELIKHCIDYLFLCSQYSLAVKESGALTNATKILIAERIFTTLILKRSITDENQSYSDSNK